MFMVIKCVYLWRRQLTGSWLLVDFFLRGGGLTASTPQHHLVVNLRSCTFEFQVSNNKKQKQKQKTGLLKTNIN